MAQGIDNLITGLDRFRTAMLDGAAEGLDAYTPTITAKMRQTSAHGDVTGATRASYNARRVGRGEDGSAAHQASVAAVESLNPGHVGTAPVSIAGELGAIVDSATDYQRDLEVENAGEKAVVGPTIAGEALNLTAAAARGSRVRMH